VVRHVVLFRFREDASAEQRRAVLDGISSLPDRFPALERFQQGENVSRRDDRFTHGFVAEVATRADLEAYLDSEGHEHFVATLFRPAVEERAIVSFEV
jgi:2,3-dihydroxy-p-cumate/2,3-dihydroxybenzoate 3,4-dioxygenase